MLARARDTLPPAGIAVWQQKLDGYRVIVFLRSGAIHLQSRRGADLTAAFPDVAAAASTIYEDLVLDGELVVLRGGWLDFEALLQRARYTGRRAADAARAMPAHVVAFDLLEADGEALLSRPYRERWARWHEGPEGEAVARVRRRTKDGDRQARVRSPLTQPKAEKVLSPPSTLC
jgi:ATP-dependent DNA ligase